MRRLGLQSACLAVFVCFALTDSRADKRQNYLNTQLIEMSWEGKNEQVERLLSRGAQVNGRSRYGDTPLLAAVEKRHVETVRLLLARGAHVNTANKNRQTALIIAARSDDIDTVRSLLKAGADVNAVDYSGNTALMKTEFSDELGIRMLLRKAGAHYELLEATYFRDEAAARAMLDQEANPNIRDRNGTTPLMIAALWAEAEADDERLMLKVLLAHRANPDAVDKQGRTALMNVAAKPGPSDTQNARILLKRGAAVNKRDYRGDNALLLAAGANNDTLVMVLLEAGANKEARDRQGQTALIRAADWYHGYEGAWSGLGKAIGPLLARGAEVNAQDKTGQTALLIAARHGHEDNLKELLAAGADPNLADKQGVTPLMWAARNAAPSQIKILQDAGARTGLIAFLLMGDEASARGAIANGANVNARGPYGQTPLIIAARKGSISLLHLLLDRGAQVNAHDEDGITALHNAVGAERWGLKSFNVGFVGGLPTQTDAQDRPNVIALLLQQGADVNSRDKEGNAALVWAARWGFKASVRALLTSGARTQQHSLSSALVHGRRETFSLLEQGADPNFHEKKDDYARLVYETDTAAMRALLTAGADPNRSGRGGKSPLLLAVERGDEAQITLLLAYSANPDLQDDSGETALMCAAYNGKIAIVRQLLAAGANPRLRDYEDKTALEYAQMQKQVGATALLQAESGHL